MLKLGYNALDRQTDRQTDSRVAPFSRIMQKRSRTASE